MASSEHKYLATANSIVTTIGSVAATIMVFRSITGDLLPSEFQDFIFSSVRNFFSRFSNQLTLVIDEFDGLVNNEFYDSAVIYLGQKVSPSTRRLKISKPEKENHFNITMERGEQVLDIYNGQKFKWEWICRKAEIKSYNNPRDMNSSFRSETRSFELTFHKRNMDLVVNSYLPYIIKEAQMKKHEKRTIKILTVDYQHMFNLNNVWTPVTLDHPATFETLAMDSGLKEMIVNDLDRFVNRRDYYRQVGKAWKRGYLLYGPPGTGKSSLIAAMANYLNFDVYDLELSELRQNSELRKLLVATANKSILVVEDIDCTIDLQETLANRTDNFSYGYRTRDEKKVTLSGLLNFVDGLWSSCGDERIIVFTTNHIEKLDPALLRPGRMDVHIHLSYCTPSAFKVLASNYLGIKEHDLFNEIEGLIEKAKVTPAEVAEQLLKSDDSDVSLRGLIVFMLIKVRENEEAEKLKTEPAEKVEIVLLEQKNENGHIDENNSV